MRDIKNLSIQKLRPRAGIQKCEPVKRARQADIEQPGIQVVVRVGTFARVGEDYAVEFQTLHGRGGGDVYAAGVLRVLGVQHARVQAGGKPRGQRAGAGSVALDHTDHAHAGLHPLVNQIGDFLRLLVLAGER